MKEYCREHHSTQKPIKKPRATAAVTRGFSIEACSVIDLNCTASPYGSEMNFRIHGVKCAPVI
jgi:hypothetical protein